MPPLVGIGLTNQSKSGCPPPPGSNSSATAAAAKFDGQSDEIDDIVSPACESKQVRKVNIKSYSWNIEGYESAGKLAMKKRISAVCKLH